MDMEDPRFDAFFQSANLLGLKSGDFSRVMQRKDRVVALTHNACTVHFVQSESLADGNPDLEKEGRVLSVISNHLAGADIVTPKVLQTATHEYGVIQLRTAVNGVSYEEAKRAASFCLDSFSLHLGQSIAKMHACPLTELVRDLSLKDDFQVQASEAAVLDVRSRMDKNLWGELNDVRLEFNASASKSENHVLIHNDIFKGNFRLSPDGQSLAGFYDFGNAYIGHYAREFYTLKNNELLCPALFNSYETATGRSINPTFVMAEQITNQFLQCCHLPGRIPGRIQDDLADRLSALNDVRLQQKHANSLK